MQAYSDPERENDPHALPDLEIFELTAVEIAAMDEDLVYEYMQHREFRLAAMNSAVQSDMLDAIVEDHNIQGGWFYWYCFPGCLPDSSPYGPFETAEAALKDARDAVGLWDLYPRT